MDKMEMLRNYEATSAADAYIIGFAIAGRVYVAKVAKLREDMVQLDRESSSHGGAAKLRLSITTRMRAILRNAGALEVGSVAEVLEAGMNKGEAFEKWYYKRCGQVWTKDNVPYWKDGDITVNGEKLQLKWENASLTNENVIRKAMEALAV